MEKDFRPVGVEVVIVPAPHAGLSAALRRAYAVPPKEASTEFERLLARIH